MPQRDVGVYQVGELLGEGGMGRVYRGYDPRLDRWVALEHVRPDADYLERRAPAAGLGAGVNGSS
ncbi:MAG: hypothetical protein AAF560_01150 [Acidobacteriota bacterium]